jgi:hypothetical protein
MSKESRMSKVYLAALWGLAAVLAPSVVRADEIPARLRAYVA